MKCNVFISYVFGLADEEEVDGRGDIKIIKINFNEYCGESKV